MPKSNITLDFTFFAHLLDFYQARRGEIRQHYRHLSKRFLDWNDPEEGGSRFLRRPQFEALEMYVFLKEYLDNARIHTIFEAWYKAEGRFEKREAIGLSHEKQAEIFDRFNEADYKKVFANMRKQERIYPNYIFALTMGTGKTILMGTCIFYEFILANKFPKDAKYCHNALVFAPDKTVLQSLRELETFDWSKVVPAEYISFLNTHIKFHFLEESGIGLSTLEGSRFNIVVSNTQKIILKQKHKDTSSTDKLFASGKAMYEKASVYDVNADLYELDEPQDDVSLTANQRFEKLTRLKQLGIYIDEAHHVFGNKLAKDMGKGNKPTDTSLRTTVDQLAARLKNAGTRVVACYNYTGTPYAGKTIFPEVVYAFGLKAAIDKQYLKQVHVHDYTTAKSQEFLEVVLEHFIKHHQDQRHEGMLPKLAIFAATIEELQNELRPAVEAVLIKHGLPTSKILVNVGNDKLTSNDDIREFNRLDTPHSDKQFILLVNKGREGWNCRSLFGVALFREPKSKVFVLQATMRCLRAIGEAQQTGHVYLSEKNKDILDAELQQNFRLSVADLNQTGNDKQKVQIHVNTPPVTIKLHRVRRQYDIQEKQLTPGLELGLAELDISPYRLIHTEQAGFDKQDVEKRKQLKTEDLSQYRAKRHYSALTLVAEIARYLNKSCLAIESLLQQTREGIDGILKSVNKFNAILYDVVIPRLFAALYDLTPNEQHEEYEVELVKTPPQGYYEFTAAKDKIVRQGDAPDNKAAKSFHLDTYCFDSNPERELFWHLIQDGRVKKLYFTGMLTHGQSEFYVQYIDPDSHTVRSYYPDFLYQKEDDTYVIVEVKGDNKLDDPVVLAKKDFAEQMATASRMTYKTVPSTQVDNYKDLLFGDGMAQEDKQYG